MLQDQMNVCCLCQQIIDEDAVLDHDHKTGQIRGVLHRGCNAMLGKIENSMKLNKMDIARLEIFCQNIIKYITEESKPLLHPTHRTQEEKKLLQKKRRQRANKKKNL